MIKNMVFDMGRVLLEFQPLEYLSKEYPRMAGELHERIFRNENWLRMDEGALSLEEFCEETCRNWPENSREIRAVLEGWPEKLLRPIEPTVELLEDLEKRGYSLYYLSNMSRAAADWLPVNMPFLSRFQGGVYSCDVLCNKPAPGIYQALFSEYHLDPRECLFFDDVRENIDGGKAAGMEGIVFTSAEEARAQLNAQYGISV